MTFYDRVKMSTATEGAGTITLGAAQAGFRSFADAGVPDGATVSYAIEDGGEWEVGTGFYAASSATLTRTVQKSSNGDDAISLSGGAVVWLNCSAADLNDGMAAWSSFGRSLVDDLDAATARTTLGLGGSATLDEATAAQYRNNTADKVLSTDQVWSAATSVALTPGVSVAVDMSAGINFTLAMGGDYTLDDPTNAKDGQSGTIMITQDGVGGRTLAYGSNWKFAGGNAPVLSTAAGTVDLLNYKVLTPTFVVASLLKDVS